MTAILCARCKRPNGASARTCIWCEALLAECETIRDLEATTIEADYLDGIARLDDSGPVRLIITRECIEIVETLPGSRSIRIPARSILETRVERSDLSAQPAHGPWWQSLRKGLFSGSRRDRSDEEHRYVLAVKYKTGDEVFTGLFAYMDRNGRATAQKIRRLLGKSVDGRRLGRARLRG